MGSFSIHSIGDSAFLEQILIAVDLPPRLDTTLS